MRQLQSKLNINILDKGKVAYKAENKITVVDFKEIKALVTNGEITANTEVFDNSVSTIDEYNSRWIAPAGNTWLKRYFS